MVTVEGAMPMVNDVIEGITMRTRDVEGEKVCTLRRVSLGDTLTIATLIPRRVNNTCTIERLRLDWYHRAV